MNPHDAIVKISTSGICGDTANLNAAEAEVMNGYSGSVLNGY